MTPDNTDDGAPYELIDRIMALVGDEPMDRSSFALMVCLDLVLEHLPAGARQLACFNLAHPANLYQA